MKMSDIFSQYSLDPLGVPVVSDFGYGTDLWCESDLAADGRSVSGPAVVTQRIYHRITTPRGSLPDDPDWGIDVADWLLTGKSTLGLSSTIRAEIMRDEMIESVDVSVNEGQSDIQITISGLLVDGQAFSLVMALTSAGALLQAMGVANGGS